MKLLEQILNELGADEMKSITLVPGSCCYLKSVRTITDFSDAKIVLQCGKNRVTVEGEGLTVGKFFEGDLLVEGGVKAVKVD